MTLTCGFFNAVSHDRIYDAVQISSIFDGIITDGVYAAIGDHLMVSEDSGMNILVGTGRAWFNHTWSYNDADISLTVGQAHALQDRFDAVVLEINSDIGVRLNTIKIVAGTPSANPVPPTLTNTEYVHQYPLAYIEVPAGVTSIPQMYIINKIGSLDCPFVTGPLSVITTNELLTQWEAEFNDWFDFMKDHLGEDPAGDLQEQIVAIVGDLNPPLIDLVTLKDHNHTGDTRAIPTEGLQDWAVTDAKLAPYAVTNLKIAADAITEVKIDDDAVTTNKIKALAVTSSKLASGAVTPGKIGLGGVSAGNQLANYIVDESKVGNRVLKIQSRQGGSPTDWQVSGAAPYIPSMVREEVGVAGWSGTPTNSGVIAVTYPSPFTNKPIVYLTVQNLVIDVRANAANVTSLGFSIYWFTDTNTSSIAIGWSAKGPE